MEEQKNLVLFAGGEEETEKEKEKEKVGFDFEPSEDELVLHFLRPQLRGFAPRVPGAVVEADPCAATPWELLARHGLLQRGHGYFFAARRRGNAVVRRTPAGGGGSWMHSGNREHGRSVTALGVVARWSRTRYGFYVLGGAEGRRSTGWVMTEYEITDPLCYRRADEGAEDEYWVLCHVRRSCRTNAGKPSSRRRSLVLASI
ncbi:NAC domain-containing protein 48-like [Lolium rigidum]|uniref:NAC domain-containing protein 48-like n=1 Tax=Lolium rigidum TaxID=89674 RepID=UPI001F5D243A|nr:NAC domain-containing protein 48-like [Lolium rigidum]